jgi:hypothetical protein
VARPVDGDEVASTLCDIGAFEYEPVYNVYVPLVLRDY